MAIWKAREHTHRESRVKVRHGASFQQRFRAFTRLAALFFTLALALVPSACTPAHGTIGAVLGQKPDGRLFVRDVPPDLAAAKHGLQPGDEILLVDGKDVRAMDEATLQRTLGGEVGAPLEITAVRNDEIVRVTLKRTPARRATRPPAED